MRPGTIMRTGFDRGTPANRGYDDTGHRAGQWTRASLSYDDGRTHGSVRSAYPSPRQTTLPSTNETISTRFDEFQPNQNNHLRTDDSSRPLTHHPSQNSLDRPQINVAPSNATNANRHISQPQPPPWVRELYGLMHDYHRFGGDKLPVVAMALCHGLLDDRVVHDAMQHGFLRSTPLDITKHYINGGQKYKKHGTIRRMTTGQDYGWMPGGPMVNDANILRTGQRCAREFDRGPMRERRKGGEGQFCRLVLNGGSKSKD